MRPSLSPAYGIARGLCIAACMWAPVIVGGAYAAWTAISYGIDRDTSAHLERQEAFVSIRTANGGAR